MQKLNEAQRELVERNLGLARLAVCRTAELRRPVGLDDDDAYAIACEGLVRGAMRFDPSRGFQESSYLFPAAVNGIRMECRSLGRKIHTFAVSLDREYGQDGFTLADTLSEPQTLEEAVTQKADAMNALAAMDTLERRCFLAWYQGAGQKAIAEQIGYTQSAVSRLIKRGKAKGRKAVME